MDWTPFVKGSIPALGATICFFLAMKIFPRLSRRKNEQKITYERLKRDRDIFVYMLYFSGMWVMWVAPQVNDVAGREWMVVIFAVSVWIVRYVLLFIDNLFHRTKKESTIYTQSSN
ncbi:hypothetical protein KKC97_06800 [bacterium]|nr:hypothetical protein [bacterium]MBU1637357.1 hypothetical protein [bacterium]MBU1919617.1 hypothetical protein [bacterium]